MGQKKRKHATQREDSAKRGENTGGQNRVSLEQATRSVFDPGFAILSMSSAVVFGVYVYTMYPAISGGDSGELMAAAHELGVAHPPGYPLFTMLSWLALKLIPMGNMAWRMNLLNAAFAASAAFFYALAIHRYTGSVGCAVVGSSLWCLCKLTWTWSSMAEVFGLNNLFLTSLLYVMVTYEQVEMKEKEKTAKLGAFLCGLSLCNQHTIVVYVAVVAMWVLLDLHKLKLLTWLLLVKLGMYFLLGLVPYIYIPLSAFISPGRWSWGDQRTVEGFLKHLLRQEYGTFDLAKDQSTDNLLIPGLRAYGSHVVSEFTVVAVILTVIGVYEGITRWKKSQHSVVVAMGMCVLYVVLFSSRANLNLDNPLFLGVVERFWMQSDCVVVLVASIGLSTLFRFIQRSFSNVGLHKWEIAIAVSVFGLQVHRNMPLCNQRDNTVVAEFGHRLMDNFPHNSLVLTQGDLPSNVLRYLYLVENNRPDIDLFDQEILTYGWSLPMLRGAYPNITFPGHHMNTYNGIEQGTKLPVFNFLSFLNSNYHRPIIACIGVQNHETSWQQGYRQIPFGPCSRLQKVTEEISLEDNINLVLNISDGWPYPYEGFDRTSWERVATNEMWNAKINLGFYLYEMAGRSNNVIEKTALYVKSYEIYKRAVTPLTVTDTPSYFHKNFALVCEKLLSLSHSISKSVALEESIYHFEMYAQKAGEDESSQVALVREVIQTLKGYRRKLS